MHLIIKLCVFVTHYVALIFLHFVCFSPSKRSPASFGGSALAAITRPLFFMVTAKNLRFSTHLASHLVPMTSEACLLFACGIG